MRGPRFAGTEVAVGGQSLPPGGREIHVTLWLTLTPRRSLSTRRQGLCFLNPLAMSQTGRVKVVRSQVVKKAQHGEQWDLQARPGSHELRSFSPYKRASRKQGVNNREPLRSVPQGSGPVPLLPSRQRLLFPSPFWRSGPLDVLWRFYRGGALRDSHGSRPIWGNLGFLEIDLLAFRKPRVGRGDLHQPRRTFRIH